MISNTILRFTLEFDDIMIDTLDSQYRQYGRR